MGAGEGSVLGQRQIVSRNSFHDYCGTNINTHTQRDVYGHGHAWRTRTTLRAVKSEEKSLGVSRQVFPSVADVITRARSICGH